MQPEALAEEVGRVGVSDFLSVSPKMLKIKELAETVADVDVPVLILGESGVGKEVIARFIHDHSRRRNHPFVKINCAALPHDLLEAELFGFERGAFTGAIQQKPGKFELAGKGSLLLDEIGEMNPFLQAKILHVLQDCEYSRIGGKGQVRVNSRILATTNKKLEEAVAHGEFREDLYFRLNVIRIEVPPLRDRTEDIPLLSSYFFEKYCRKYERNLTDPQEQLLQVFLVYDWPGNVRELENAIKRYVILPDLDLALSELCQHGWGVRDFSSRDSRELSLKEIGAQAAEQAERKAALYMLERTNWNRKQAAQRLGICYKALLNKLKKWQIEARQTSSYGLLAVNPRSESGLRPREVARQARPDLPRFGRN